MNCRALISVLLIPSVLYAQTPPIATIPPGDDKISVIHKGDQAPSDGQLYSTDTALRWAFWLQQYKYRLKSDVEQVQQVCKAETEYRDKSLVVEKTRADKVEKDLADRLLRSEKARLSAEDEARNPPWYRTREFGLVLGVVGTARLVSLSVWVIQTRK